MRVGGALPTNTDGGGLSACHPGMRGMFLLVEAVRQLRGEAAGRQVRGRRARVRERHRRLVLVGQHGHPRRGVGIEVVEGRPSVWIGHTVLAVGDVDRSADYWRDLGMREVERNEDVAVLELRGGTHLVLVPGTSAEADDAPFDLMVEDSTRHTPNGTRPGTRSRRRSRADASMRASRCATRTATA